MGAARAGARRKFVRALAGWLKDEACVAFGLRGAQRSELFGRRDVFCG